jgi:hypothetical protein
MMDRYRDPVEIKKYTLVNDKKPQFNPENLIHLYNFITERYKIFKLREKCELSPWTTNPILNTYKFTNVRREHDYTTRWYIEKIANNTELTIQDKMLRAIAFRLYSKVESAMIFGLHSKNPIPDYSKRTTVRNLNPDYNVYTSAFYTVGMVTALLRSFPHATRQTVPMVLINHLDIMYDLQELVEKWTNPEQVTDWLMKIKGISKFLAYQIFVDWTYITDFPFSENYHVLAGPGAVRGINNLFTDKASLTDEKLLFWLADNLETEFVNSVDKDFSCEELFDNLPKHDRKFNVMSLQNCMCELSKYIKAVTNVKNPREKYRPKAERMGQLYVSINNL